jgi:predicted amidophosphoribosyltransferase
MIQSANVNEITATPLPGKRWNFCPECGQKLEDAWKHCPGCGQAIGETLAAPYVRWYWWYPVYVQPVYYPPYLPWPNNPIYCSSSGGAV